MNFDERYREELNNRYKLKCPNCGSPYHFGFIFWFIDNKYYCSIKCAEEKTGYTKYFSPGR